MDKEELNKLCSLLTTTSITNTISTTTVTIILFLALPKFFKNLGS
jgi:hypothetical protein